MKRPFISLLILGICLLWTAPLHAGSDEYMGDASIYAGIPTTMSRPNHRQQPGHPAYRLGTRLSGLEGSGKNRPQHLSAKAGVRWH